MNRKRSSDFVRVLMGDCGPKADTIPSVRAVPGPTGATPHGAIASTPRPKVPGGPSVPQAAVSSPARPLPMPPDQPPVILPGDVSVAAQVPGIMPGVNMNLLRMLLGV